MSGDVSLGQVAAGGGGLAAIWQFGRWLLLFQSRSLQRREADVTAREERLDKEEAEQVKHLRADVAALISWQQQATKELESHRIAIAILINKVVRDDPQAPELRQVKRLLGEAFPIDFNTPPDLTNLVDKLK